MIDGTRDAAFLAALEKIPEGHSEGTFRERRWRAALNRSPDGRRVWLYAEPLDGSDHVSFNLYLLTSGAALRPCEMPAEKVMASVLGYWTAPART